MSEATVAGPLGGSAKGKIQRAATILTSIVIVGLAVYFILNNALHYYLQYDQASFGRFWTRPAALLLHTSGGIVALLTGPWQFWSGYRRTPMQVHRWTGRLFLAGVAIGSAGAVYLSITTTNGWAFGFGLFMMGVAWVSTAGMAYYAIRQRQIETHKEWMIRAYVVTFSFVTFRVFARFGLLAFGLPLGDTRVTLSWASWAVPLLITELILQLKRMGRIQTARQASGALVK
jgi:predicted membrane protein DUF2306